MPPAELPSRSPAGLMPPGPAPEAADLIRAILDTAPGGMLILDPDGVVRYQNRHVAALLGVEERRLDRIPRRRR